MIFQISFPSSKSFFSILRKRYLYRKKNNNPSFNKKKKKKQKKDSFFSKNNPFSFSSFQIKPSSLFFQNQPKIFLFLPKKNLPKKKKKVSKKINKKQNLFILSLQKPFISSLRKEHISKRFQNFQQLQETSFPRFLSISKISFPFVLGPSSSKTSSFFRKKTKKLHLLSFFFFHNIYPLFFPTFFLPKKKNK